MANAELNKDLCRENRKRRMIITRERRQRRRIEHIQDLCANNRKRRTPIIPERRQRRRIHYNNEETPEQLHVNETMTTELPIPRTGTSTKKYEYLYLGDPEYKCQKCDAIMWFDERIKSTSTKNNIKFNMCCRDGKIQLPKMREAPDFLRRLLDYTGDKRERLFKEKIRIYNSCFAFTSMGAKIDKSINMTPGTYVFRISGQIIHRIGSLLPVDGKEPSYAQLYIYDSTTEILMREKAVGKQEGSPKLDVDILNGIKEMLDDVNPLAQTYRMAQERLKENNNEPISIRLLGTREPKERVYNSPTASEVVALIVNAGGENTNRRDIVIEHKSDGLKPVRELDPSFMALQYPLLFPYGEDSYHLKIKYKNPGRGKRTDVTMRDYYAYRIQRRLSEGRTMHSGGRLYQQFLVDCCCAIESDRLRYIKSNQEMFRCDILNNICDAVAKGDAIGYEIGKRVYLPASFTGGPRYMQQNYQDAMAICRCYGNPHLFITFTANSEWPEVESMLSLIENQKAEDRPDIIARVFKLKLQQLMHCLKKKNYFGQSIADVCTIEFQKRGKPHAHILLWLKKDKQEISTEYINNIIHAEISDINEEPELYKAVSRYMVHGPCGTANPKCPCMINNNCSKKFPKIYNEETTIDQNGYPIYRRRKDSRYIKKGPHQLDNRSIVPYNPGLLLMFDAHINVEWCNTARAIKYLFKYISKGPDKATMIVKDNSNDEIKSYLDCRYLSASEAAWRIFEYEIQERYPAVMRLPVHLKGEQAVVIKDDDILKVIIVRQNDAETMLTSWMTTNKTYPEARHLTYAEFPTQYVWDKGWKKRKQGMCIGRMSYVHPTADERYYLRLLLNIVKGAQSYEDIRTVNGQLYKSNHDACYALGLLNNDKESNDAMREANQWAMPSQLRELFVTMLLFCEVTDVTSIWETNYSMLSEDIERKKRKLFKHPDLILTEEARKSYTLIEIDKVLMKYGKRLQDIKNMPQPKKDVEGLENKLIREEKLYDRQKLHEDWSMKVHQLNNEQREVHDAVINDVNKEADKVIFVYGHGGTGKTFLYGTIAAKIRSENKIVLTVASSGIAALLLPGGRTAHSKFDIPIELFEDSTCNVKQKSHLAELLQQTSLIIWDEAPMDHKFAFEALDRTMRDIVGIKIQKHQQSCLEGRLYYLEVISDKFCP